MKKFFLALTFSAINSFVVNANEESLTVQLDGTDIDATAWASFVAKNKQCQIILHENNDNKESEYFSTLIQSNLAGFKRLKSPQRQLIEKLTIEKYDSISKSSNNNDLIECHFIYSIEHSGSIEKLTRLISESISPHLPMSLNKNMSIMAVAGVGDTITYSILLNYSKEYLYSIYKKNNVKISDVKKGMKNFADNSCADYMKEFRGVGGKIKFIYSFIDGRRFFDYELDCHNASQDETRTTERQIWSNSGFKQTGDKVANGKKASSVLYADAANSIINAFKKMDKNEISNLISYPLRREYPIPEIKNKKEFVERFDQIFDLKFIDLITSSNIEKDWSKMGSRGIMLANGELWINEGGKVIAINYQSATEEKIKKDIIDNERLELHKSISNYKQPVLNWKTKNFTIRIDSLENGFYRYSSWGVNIKVGSKPDLVLNKGKMQIQGSAGNREYIFNNGKYSYRVSVNILGKDHFLGSLSVFREGKKILNEDFTEDLNSKLR